MSDLNIDPRTILNPTSLATQTSQAKKARDLASLKESAQEFEALYVMEMFKAMRQTIPEGGLLEKNNAMEIFEGMLDMETARASSKGQGVGIADMIYRQMSELIEKRKD